MKPNEPLFPVSNTVHESGVSRVGQDHVEKKPSTMQLLPGSIRAKVKVSSSHLLKHGSNIKLACTPARTVLLLLTQGTWEELRLRKLGSKPGNEEEMLLEKTAQDALAQLPEERIFIKRCVCIESRSKVIRKPVGPAQALSAEGPV